MKGDMINNCIIMGGVQKQRDYAILLVMKALKLIRRNHYAEF